MLVADPYFTKDFETVLQSSACQPWRDEKSNQFSLGVEPGIQRKLLKTQAFLPPLMVSSFFRV